MRRVLSFVVSVGVFSSLLPGVSGSASNFDDGYFFNKKSRITKSREYLCKKGHCENNTTKSANEKNKSESTSLKIVKCVLSFTVNVCLANILQSLTDNFKITDSRVLSDRVKNLFSTTKNGLSPKRFLISVIKNQQAMKDMSNMFYRVPVYQSIFSIANRVLAMLGLPDLSTPFALYSGIKGVLTSVKDPQQAALESAVDFFDKDGVDDKSEKDVNKLPGRKRT